MSSPRKTERKNSRHYGAAVIHRSSSSIRTKAILGSLGLLTFACGALAQAPRAEAASAAVPLTQPVPLVSGSCQTVRQGGVLSLDWNPDFYPSGAVTGLKAFRLVFNHLLADEVNLNPAWRLVLDVGPHRGITAIANGYFRIEARLPPSTHLGTYRLVAAHGSPEVPPDYQGEAPKMTVSPAREYLCITVVPVTRASSSPRPE